MGRYTSLLFAEPTFFEGVGRILDFGGTLTEFNRSPTGEMADALAMKSDWMAVGADLDAAMQACSPGAPGEQRKAEAR